MTKKERIEAAIKCEEVDKIPASVWMHFSADDQDVVSLAEAQVAMARKYDYDFIKLMPFGLYGVQDYGVKVKVFSQVGMPPIVDDYAIHTIKDWEKLNVLPATYGTYSRTVQLAERVGKMVGDEIPFIQTVFSPLTTARKMAGDRILVDMKQDSKLFKQALQVLTDTTINFVKANIEAGVSGFFFATQCCNSTFMTEEEYKEFGVAFDMQVINAYKDATWFNVGHLHGANGMFKLFTDMPFNVINWHDTWGGPNMAEARKLTDKCFLGGIKEIGYVDEDGREHGSILTEGTKEDVIAAIKAATIEQIGKKGVMFGPGCVADQFATETGLAAVTEASRLLA